MYLPKKQIVAAVLAVIYGVFIALGQMLHVLPGLQHAPTPGGERTVCCVSCHHHSALPVEGANKLTPAQATANSKASLHFAADDRPANASAHECPLCELLSLAQNGSSSEPAIAIAWRAEVASLPSVVLDCSDPYEPYSARGPPIALRQLV